MAIDRTAWQRDWAVAPGAILQEALQDRDMSQSEIARRMGRPIKTINEIINGKAAITPHNPLPLGVAAGVGWGERAAADIQTEPFAAARLGEVLVEIRGLPRREPLTQTLSDVHGLLAGAGVALVVTPEVGKTRLSGAARWLSP